jgi:Family of unknown function (DUF6069)
MSAIASSTTAPGRLASMPVSVVGVAAGITAAAATELYGLVARAAGVPMAAAGLGSPHAGTITVGMFAMGTLICTFWGTALAVSLHRYAARPGRIFTLAALALTAVSLVAPLSAADTAASTKAMLAVAHLLAAAIVIPLLARRLRHPNSRRTRTA